MNICSMYFEYKIYTDFQRFIYYLIVKLNEGCRENYQKTLLCKH